MYSQISQTEYNLRFSGNEGIEVMLFLTTIRYFYNRKFKCYNKLSVKSKAKINRKLLVVLRNGKFKHHCIRRWNKNMKYLYWSDSGYIVCGWSVFIGSYTCRAGYVDETETELFYDDSYLLSNGWVFLRCYQRVTGLIFAWG